MTARLLPDNAQPYPRAVADALDTRARLAPAIGLIPTIGRTNAPVDWLPWLLRDRGLQRLMPFVDWQVLFARGPAWLRLRGTPAASVEALGWIGWDVAFEDGAAGAALYDHYHLHLPDVPGLDTLAAIIGIERVAKSSDSRFFRLVHGYDIRPVRGGHSRFARSLWARHSGIDLRADWPRLSFRLRPNIHIATGSRAIAALTLTVASRAVRRGHVVHARSRLPELSSRGPVWGMQLSDSSVARASAAMVASDGIRPVAGLRGGRSILGRRQSLFVAMRRVLGERPVTGRMRCAGSFRRATSRQLMMAPTPLAIAAGGQAALRFVVAAESLVVRSHAAAGSERLVAVAARGEMSLGFRIDTGAAPWSGLPFFGAWGESPRVLATDLTVEND